MSLALILEMASSALDDRIAVGRAAGGVTFGQVADNAARGAGVIADRAPSHLVYIGRNGPAYPQLIFAAAMAGVPFVPMNYRLSSDALVELIASLERPLVVVEAAFEVPLDAGSDPSLRLSVEEFFALAAQSEPQPAVHVADDAPAILLYTSGTTSRPKAVVLTHQNLLSYILSTVEFAGAGPDEAALVSVPPYHVAGVGSALSNFYAGRRIVHLPDFDAATWLDLVATEAITSAMLVPTMLARIVDTLGGEIATAPALNLISYGGAKTPRPVLEKALAAFPATGFCNAYGLTETSSTLALLGPDDHRAAIESADPAIHDRLGSVGRPVPGIEVQVRGPGGSEQPTGVAGELYVRGPQVSGEYAGLGSALDADGWFPTKDIAYVDADGFIFIGGRSDDTIIRGGENISPAEIEEVLFEHPGVKDVAVIGVPDEEWGQRLVAVVVPVLGSSSTSEDLRDYVRGRLRGSRTPDQIAWSTELPTTPTGKLLRRVLVEELSESTTDTATANGSGLMKGTPA